RAPQEPDLREGDRDTSPGSRGAPAPDCVQIRLRPHSKMASGWFRAFLRRVGIGERRWIPPRAERAAHTELVRDRLPKTATKDPDSTTQGETPPRPGDVHPGRNW